MLQTELLLDFGGAAGIEFHLFTLEGMVIGLGEIGGDEVALALMFQFQSLIAVFEIVSLSGGQRRQLTQ